MHGAIVGPILMSGLIGEFVNCDCVGMNLKLASVTKLTSTHDTSFHCNSSTCVRARSAS